MTHFPAVQVLKFSGFSPIITYASGHHADYLKSIGATHVVDRKTVSVADLPSEVKKITSAPVKTVFDAVSQADTQEAGYETLSEGGGISLVLPKSIKNVVEGKKIYEFFGSVTPPFNREFGVKVYSQLTQLLSDGTFVVGVKAFDALERFSHLFNSPTILRKFQVDWLE